MTVRSRTAAAVLAGFAVGSLTLTACGQGGAGEAPGPNDKIKVVASTNVWGSVAKAVGGDAVEVTSIIDDANADPHSYESSPREAAEISDADLVIRNGGGYDEFMGQILQSAGDKPVVTAVETEHEGHGGEAGGHEGGGHEERGGQHAEPQGGGHAGHDHSVNEHVWYDTHAVEDVAGQVAEQLGKLQPGKAQQFTANAEGFKQEVAGLQSKLDQIATADRGKPIVVTAPVAHYLVEASGVDDVTPPEFVRAVESETDPSAAAVAQIKDALNAGRAQAVLFNPQTASPVTEDVRKTAEAKGIPVVEMTETLPEGKNYVQWMDGQITALRSALNGAR
ncbi:metal ABC transporter solute-binding protein, Zn/Mn family [Saccharopolyspora griseoalba]|uniref:Metal ABC transporter solute-binding protein, Zn/Mn family n=1 Tax=Saccharopolyspora griseoalba TaxID=1431848 RepID=A0ABW2LFY2_9PSEU